VSLKLIAQRLQMVSWNYVSNLLTQKHSAKELKKWGLTLACLLRRCVF
jgi:hypothetical protein